MRKNYDFVIIGAGSFGAWTAYHLRLAGFHIALLDAYGAANSRASSGGETRIIRMGYGPDELYTRWSLRSLDQWKNIAERAKLELFRKTGVLWLSNEGDPHTEQMLQVLKRNGVDCSRLFLAEIQRGYPQLKLQNVDWGILEPESGVLMARQSVQSLVNKSIDRGVDYFNSQALPLATTGVIQEVRTSSGVSFSAATFIFACGPWLPKIFPDLLSERIRSTRQEVFFLGVPAGDDSFSAPKMPVWLQHAHPLRPYCLPDIANRGMKIAFDRHGPDFDPDSSSRLVGHDAEVELREYLRENVPKLKHAPIVESRVCQYENTSSGDFLIDHHPEHKNVWLVGGGSGHGFKHGPVVGEHVRDLVLGKASVEPRFSLASKQTTRMRAVF